MLNKFKYIVNQQDHLNTLTIGSDWVKVESVNGKDIDWNLCAILEIAEAVDSLDWKHWKHNENNWNNVEVELIDTLHFIISAMLIKYKPDELAKTLAKVTEEIITSAHPDTEHGYPVTELVNTFKLLSKNIMRRIAFGEIMVAYQSFIELCIVCDIAQGRSGSIDFLLDGYIVKQTLNKFRQNNGYKDGSYIKMWDGVEDNVWAFSIANTMKKEGLDILMGLYNKLVDKYEEINE